MYHYIALRSRVVRMATQATQWSHAYAHARMLATIGSRPTTEPTRPTTDQGEGVYPERGKNKNTLYIGGGLAAVAAIWYYYATGDISKGREELGGRRQTVQDATHSVKERTQDVKAEAQSKVQAAGDQVGQTVERGKQRFEEGKDQASHRAAEARSTVGE